MRHGLLPLVDCGNGLRPVLSHDTVRKSPTEEKIRGDGIA